MRIVRAAFFLTLILPFFISCNKEKSFEVGAPATGSLRKETNGDCLLKTAVGAYIAGTALSDSNYLEVDVDVFTEGAYSISTSTENGYSFSGTGNFTKKGVNRIRLAASGTPVVAGTDVLVVTFDTTSCFVPVTVLPAGSNSGPAAFTLQGSGDSCIVAAVVGQYIQGAALTGTSTTSIKVNVTTPGTYTVTTNNVNGFQFSGSGTLAAPGEQTITLVGSGTPETEGKTFFTVTAGATTCSFLVNVSGSDTQPPSSNGDLFPLTANSWWSYSFDNEPDSFVITDAGVFTVNGKSYHRLRVSNEADGAYDSSYYRKEGSDYFTYFEVTDTEIPGLESPVKGEILVAKDNPAVGDTWQTDITLPASGADVVLRYTFTCTAANVSETLGTKPFSAVYKVTSKTELGTAGVFESFGAEEEVWYARGVGLIYQKWTEGTDSYDRTIRNWSVK